MDTMDLPDVDCTMSVDAAAQPPQQPTKRGRKSTDQTSSAQSEADNEQNPDSAMPKKKRER